MTKETTRRQFLKKISITAAALGGLSVFPHTLAAAKDKNKPNILLIMCDQLQADVLSCYGGPVDTPNIDRIANQGIRFDQATCVTPYCSPSRASIITGMYPHTHGIVMNCSPNNRQKGITPFDITTEKILNSDGYATHHYGKWNLRGDDLWYYPDQYRGDPDYTNQMASVFEKVRADKTTDYLKWYTWDLPVEVLPELKEATSKASERYKNHRHAEFCSKMGRLLLPLKKNFDYKVTSKTIKKIKKYKNHPFMQTCSIQAPHDPFVVPSPYYELFDPHKIELPKNVSSIEKRFESNWSRRMVKELGEICLREFIRIYYSLVKLIDDQVGRILKTLDDTKQTDNTIIIFTADHGDMAGGHGMIWKSTTAFYDEITRIPMLIRHPKRFKPQVSNLPVSQVDIMPTIFELLGKSFPEQCQGQSWVPFVTGKKKESEARAYTFSESISPNPKGNRTVLPGTQGTFMIRGKGLKYILYEDGGQYLYDLTKDPGETKNLIGDPKYVSKRKELESELDKWLKSSIPAFAGSQFSPLFMLLKTP